MIDESGNAEASQVQQLLHHRVAVLGGGEDRSVPGERVAAKCPGTGAEPQVELVTRGRVLAPACLGMDNGDMAES